MNKTIYLLFPDITKEQFRLQDDGDGEGPYIAHWDYPAPQPTMEEIEAAGMALEKNAIKEAINQKRDEDLLAGVEFMGELFHSDDAFRTDLTDMLMGYDRNLLTGKQNIRTKTNKIVQLDVNQILMLKLVIGQYRQMVFARSWAEKDAMDRIPITGQSANLAIGTLTAAYPTGAVGLEAPVTGSQMSTEQAEIGLSIEE